MLSFLKIICCALVSTAFLSTTVATPTAISMLYIHAPDLAIPQRDETPHSYPQIDHLPSIPRSRHKRAITRGPIQESQGHGAIIKYQQIKPFIVPAEVMAATLEAFFREMTTKVSNARNSGRPDPGDALTLNIGRVYLAIRASGSHSFITWRGVGIVLNTISQQVAMGWTSEFVSEWTYPGTDILLLVSLGVLRKIAPKRVKPN